MKQNPFLHVREFGKENRKVLCLIHPTMVRWDYFDSVIPLLEKHFHLIIPSLPGYDLENDSEFCSVECVAVSLASYLKRKGIVKLDFLYGCSIGGAIALRMLIDQRVRVGTLIMDGGILPYQMPQALTRLILIKDFLTIAVGKLGGKKLLIRAFSSDDFDQASIDYLGESLEHVSFRTIWRSFDSCNNYRLPKGPLHPQSKIYYWCAEREWKRRKRDIRCLAAFLPETRFLIIKGIDHGAFPLRKPEHFARKLLCLSEREDPERGKRFD